MKFHKKMQYSPSAEYLSLNNKVIEDKSFQVFFWKQTVLKPQSCKLNLLASRCTINFIWQQKQIKQLFLRAKAYGGKVLQGVWCLLLLFLLLYAMTVSYKSRT